MCWLGLGAAAVWLSHPACRAESPRHRLRMLQLRDEQSQGTAQQTCQASSSMLLILLVFTLSLGSHLCSVASHLVFHCSGNSGNFSNCELFRHSLSSVNRPFAAECKLGNWSVNGYMYWAKEEDAFCRLLEPKYQRTDSFGTCIFLGPLINLQSNEWKS